MNKAVFFDRDGVINKLVEREDGSFTSPFSFNEFRLYPNVNGSFALLKKYNYKIFVVTNQPHLNNELPYEELVKINEYLTETFPIDAIRFCSDRESNFFKPKTGMIEQLIEQFNIDRSSSYLIGDRWRDIVAGHNSNLKTIFLGYKYTSPKEYENIRPDYYSNYIYTACNIISCHAIIEQEDARL